MVVKTPLSVYNVRDFGLAFTGAGCELRDGGSTLVVMSQGTLEYVLASFWYEVCPYAFYGDDSMLNFASYFIDREGEDATKTQYLPLLLEAKANYEASDCVKHPFYGRVFDAVIENCEEAAAAVGATE